MNARTASVWAAIGALMVLPLVAAAFSPLLDYRRVPYIVAGFAGIAALALLLLQPLLTGWRLPYLSPTRARSIHGVTGAVLLLAVLVHVGGLYITSAPDVIDVLLFRSPTPFSIWGMVALIALLATGLAALARRRVRMRPRVWRVMHVVLGVLIAAGTVAHTLLIEGTMETVTKWMICIAVLVATALPAIDVLRRSRRTR